MFRHQPETLKTVHRTVLSHAWHRTKQTKNRQRKSLPVIYTLYFLKKSGILIDCSFTVPDGVLGCCSVGIVPPVVLGATVLPTALFSKSTLLLTISPDGRIEPTFCCPSSLAFSLEELPPTLCSPVAITVMVASSD